MSRKSGNLAVLVAVACSLVPATAARAQGYSSDPRPAPAHAYKAQPQRPPALEVAPHTTVIRRRPPRESQRALFEELRRRSHAKHKVITRTKIRRLRPAVIEPRRVVADSPRAIERRRVVYDPPWVIERYRIVEACPTHRGLFQPGGWLLSNHCCRCERY